MEMNNREPGTGSPDRTTGASVGQAVWETELPWQLAPLGETGHGGPPAATGDVLNHGPTGPVAATVGSPAAPVPSYTGATVSAPAGPAAPTTGVPGAGSEPDASADLGRRRQRGRGARAASTLSESAEEGRPRLRLSLAKPVLAGAGVISALFLLTPTVFGQDAPQQRSNAGAGDTGEDYASEGQYPDSGSTVSPRPGTSGTTKSDGADHHRIGEVAVASPTGEVRAVEPMSQSHTPAPSRTPVPSSTPRGQQPQQHWTTTVVNGTGVLEPGQSWTTNRITLVFQGDGNLVLYDKKGTPLWWSGTVGQGAKAVFQADGNFAVYTQNGATAWSSRTDGHNGAQLVLGADGNVMIRSGGAVLWSTGTAM
ncbi:hypothetical protein ACFWBB_09520 [Streptomyces sp. NPDC060000]|uniref:hypothetical protein n=1 Tax=Streptomyces sp. NPDC060000 TaxID=3347031 RepID=UPI0036B6BEA9